jgi:hypothetical protein
MTETHTVAGGTAPGGTRHGAVTGRKASLWDVSHLLVS